MITETQSLVNRTRFKLNLFYIIWTKNLGTWLKIKNKQKMICPLIYFFIYYKCVNYPLSNAAKAGNRNREKFTFDLIQKNRMYQIATVLLNN